MASQPGGPTRGPADLRSHFGSSHFGSSHFGSRVLLPQHSYTACMASSNWRFWNTWRWHYSEEDQWAGRGDNDTWHTSSAQPWSWASAQDTIVAPTTAAEHVDVHPHIDTPAPPTIVDDTPTLDYTEASQNTNAPPHGNSTECGICEDSV